MMNDSKLVNYTLISPCKSVRTHKIDTISIHCMAGNLSIEACGKLFYDRSRKCSSNYGIGTDGRTGMYVPEEYRSWCTSNAINDNRAVTIEVANDGGAGSGWHVSDKALAALVNLLVDVCKRNGIARLVYSPNKGDRIYHRNGANMTLHRDFAAKACPGDYLVSKHPWIATEVSKRLAGSDYIHDGLNYGLVFDPEYYASHYNDLAEAFGNDREALFQHFLTFGMNEARQAHKDFDPIKYRQKYPDLNAMYGDEWRMYYKHYIVAGHNEIQDGLRAPFM